MGGDRVVRRGPVTAERYNKAAHLDGGEGLADDALQCPTVAEAFKKAFLNATVDGAGYTTRTKDAPRGL
jgi:hypothetical protein